MTENMAEAIHDSTPRAGVTPVPNPFIMVQTMMKISLDLARLNPFWAPFLPRS